MYSCLHLTVDEPRILPEKLTVFKMPGKEHEFRPLIRKMFLMACRLSGNPLKCREILRGLGTSFYGDMELLRVTG